MNEQKIRPQILETPYRLQDVCPTRKLKATEDTLRRIQKKIAFAEKKRDSPSGNNEAVSIQRRLGEQELSMSATEKAIDSREWVEKFRKTYSNVNVEGRSCDFTREWFTASDIFQQVANVYSNEI